MVANVAIEGLLQSYPEDVQILARKARECTLILSKSGVKPGLVNGATLSDPYGLLAGTGKVHRHVQLRTIRDLQQAGLKQLVSGGSAECHKRTGQAREKR
jgi:hypothetical protein